MLDPEEQESQIVAPLHEHAHFSPPSTYGDPRAQPQSPLAFGSGELLFSAIVDQEQDSFRSRVGETQFVDLEKDTQALDDNTLFSPGTERLLDNVPAQAPSVPVTEKVLFQFKKPEPIQTEELNEGWKWSVAAKPVSGQYNLPQRNVADEGYNAKQVELPVAASLASERDLEYQLEKEVKSQVSKDAFISAPAERVPNLSHKLNSRVPYLASNAGRYSCEHLDPELQVSVLNAQKAEIPAVNTHGEMRRSTSSGRRRMKRPPFPEMIPTPNTSRSVALTAHESIVSTQQLRTPLLDTARDRASITAVAHSVASDGNITAGIDVTSANQSRPDTASSTSRPHYHPSDIEQASLQPGNKSNIKSPTAHIVNPPSKDTIDTGSFENCSITINATIKPPFHVPAQRSQTHHEEIAAPSTPTQHHPRSNSTTGISRYHHLQQSSPRTSSRDPFAQLGKNTFYQPPLQGLSRTSSQAPSENESRPVSRSNIGQAMIRPIPSQDLRPQGVTESVALGTVHSGKVAKSKSRADKVSVSEKTTSDDISSGQQTRDLHPKIRNLNEHFEERARYEAMLMDYESKLKMLEAQSREIEDMKSSEEAFKARIESLNSEKAELIRKIRKYEDICNKYTVHMNNVVDRQEFLKHLGKRHRDSISQVVNELKDCRSRGQEAVKKVTEIKIAIKDLRRQVAQADDVDKKVAAVNKEAAEKVEAAQKTENEAMDKYTTVLDEKEKLESSLRDALKSNGLLKAEIGKHLLTLSREQHNSEQLHLQLTTKWEVHKELVELLKKVPTHVMHEFEKEEGVLARILFSNNTTQAKLSNITNLVSELKTQEAPLPPSVVKLIDDLHTRVERLANLDSIDASRQESIAKQFEELKQCVGQLSIDCKIQNSLNDRITELRESNATLTAEKTALDTEVKNVSKNLDDSRQDLENSRDQLASKAEELSALHAASKEDPRLVSKIQDLESANSSLRKQLKSKDQEIAQEKAEFSALQETSIEALEQRRNIEEDLEVAHTKINSFESQKQEYLAECQAKADKKLQEFLKLAESSKNKLRMEHEMRVVSMNQTIAQMESELNAREKVEQSNTSVNVHQGSFASYREQLDVQKREIKALKVELAKAQNLSEIRAEIEKSLPPHGYFEGNLRELNSLQEEKTLWHEKNNQLQTRVGQLEAFESKNTLLKQEIVALQKKIDPEQDSKISALGKEVMVLRKDNADLRNQIREQQLSGSPTATPQRLVSSNALRTLHDLEPALVQNKLHGNPVSPSLEGADEDDLLLGTGHHIIQQREILARRPSNRKVNKLGTFIKSVNFSTPAQPLAKDVTQTPSFPIETPSKLIPFAEMTPVASSASSMTDLGEVMGLLGSIHSPNQMSELYIQMRNSKSSKYDSGVTQPPNTLDTTERDRVIPDSQDTRISSEHNTITAPLQLSEDESGLKYELNNRPTTVLAPSRTRSKSVSGILKKSASTDSASSIFSNPRSSAQPSQNGPSSLATNKTQYNRVVQGKLVNLTRNSSNKGDSSSATRQQTVTGKSAAPHRSPQPITRRGRASSKRAVSERWPDLAQPSKKPRVSLSRSNRIIPDSQNAS